MQNKRVLVIGPTSYVGSRLIRHLVSLDYTVFVSRRKGSHLFLLGEIRDRVQEVDEAELDGIQGIDAIINLGFVKGYFSYHDAIERSRIFATRLVEISSHLNPAIFVQISTMAVFGEKSDYTPRIIKSRSGEEYADGKLITENILLGRSSAGSQYTGIVRLGNIMGDEAPNWTGSIVSRILDLQPFCGIGEWGKSNTTFVDNIVSYILFILGTPIDRLHAFGSFHHLAEFSSVDWDKWVIPIGERLGVAREYLEAPYLKTQMLQGMNRSIRASILNYAQNPRLKRRIQSVMHQASRLRVLRPRIESLKSSVPLQLNLYHQPGERDVNFQKIISSKSEFASQILDGWSPGSEFVPSLSRIVNSLHV